MSKIKLEIERKYLLKRLPNLRYFKVLEITQYYLKDGSRIRQSTELNSNGKSKFYLTKKNKIRMGVYEEDEKNISEKQFKMLSKNADSVMNKTRYVYKMRSLKWEIDVYDIKMVTAEIELPREDFTFKMPVAIKRELIMDVTEFPQFTSRRLSDKV
jgi:CYTH domain-containing protein